MWPRFSRLTWRLNRRLLPRFRLPIILSVLALVLYFTIDPLTTIPSDGDRLRFSWQPDNVLTILEVAPDSGLPVQVGDIITAINNQPARQSAWRPLFPISHGKTLTLTIQRVEETFHFQLTPVENDPSNTWRWISFGLVGLATWAISALILLFAAPGNLEAWRTGLVFSGFAISLVALGGATYNVPASLPVFFTLVPLSAVGFIKLALRAAARPRAMLPVNLNRLLNGLTLILIGLGWIEVFILFPHQTSFELLTGISLYAMVLVLLGTALVLNPIILSLRYVRTASPTERQQLPIILVCTLGGALPSVILIIAILVARVPNLTVSLHVLALAVLPLALIPAGYGYTIFRREYLELDVFATQALTALARGGLLIALYLLIDYALRVWLRLNTSAAILRLIPFLLALGMVRLAGHTAQRWVHTLIYGTQLPYRAYVNDFAARLTASPQRATLERVFEEMTQLLQVRQAALFLIDEQGMLCPWLCLRVTEPPALPAASAPMTPGLVRTRLAQQGHPLAAALPRWVEMVTTLMTGGRAVGMFWLAQPMPDGFLNARQMQFVRQAANIMAITSETLRLFEASLKMSRELLYARDRERAQIASQIHDEPLQHISLAVNGLSLLTREVAGQAGEDSAEKLRQAVVTLHSVTRQLRQICVGLRPPVLEQGLEWAVKDVIYTFKHNNNLDVGLSLSLPDGYFLSENLTMAVYHVLLESLNNVGRHAQAGQVWVTLTLGSDGLHLSVEDDGIGNRLGELNLSDLVREQHFGIVGMIGWARSVQSEVQIGPRAEGGTRVHLFIPTIALEQAPLAQAWQPRDIG